MQRWKTLEIHSETVFHKGRTDQKGSSELFRKNFHLKRLIHSWNGYLRQHTPPTVPPCMKVKHSILNFWGKNIFYILPEEFKCGNEGQNDATTHVFPPSSSSSSGDQESCRHSVDSQGSGGVPRKQMRLDHFVAATQQLDCGFERHHYPPDSFGSTPSSKTEQVNTRFMLELLTIYI